MGHLSGVDPANRTIVYICNLKKLVQLWMFRCSFTEDDLPKPPVFFAVNFFACCCQLPDDDELSGPDGQKRGSGIDHV